MTSAAPDVVVVGAGVSGLTTAVRLAEAGCPVTVQASGTAAATTSYAAGATWSPYLVEWGPRAPDWAYRTLDVLRRLAGEPGTGVTLCQGVEAGDELPEWRDRLDAFEVLPPDQVPDGLATGWRVRAPVVDMPAYLGYLHRRAEAAGVALRRRHLRSLDEVTAAVVVNCAGIGARDLVPDPAVIPVRGQIVVVRNPGITEFYVEESDPPVYFFPQGDTVVLGGTAQPGDATTEPDPGIARAIVERCARVEPRLAGAPVVGHRVGLRPTRATVRLERDGRVIHNYGHGGAGVTLSWGCADEVARLAGAG